jgi:NDP-sugar pyrophosphorylase family protein
MIRRAMVLAAGRGTRLAPLTDTTPKPLMRVGGRPLLEHLLAFLRAGGIQEVVINLHHLGHEIEAALGDGRRFGLHVRYSWEDPILDTGGGVKHAEPLLAGAPFVIANGDSLLEIDLRELIDAHLAHGGIATLAVRADAEAARWGAVELDPDDRIGRIAGLPADATGAPRTFMFPGLHVVEPAIFDWMDADAAFSITRVTYPRLITAGIPVFGWPTTARWVTIDTPAALAAADRQLTVIPFRFLASESERD